MKLKLLLSMALLLAHSFCLFGQENESQSNTEKELQAFAKIQQYQLDHPFDLVNSMKRCVSALHISEKRMSAILQAQFAGKEIQVSEQERRQLDQLAALMRLDKEKYDQEMNRFMMANKMKPARYKQIKKKHQNSNAFQSKMSKLSAK